MALHCSSFYYLEWNESLSFTFHLIWPLSTTTSPLPLSQMSLSRKPLSPSPSTPAKQIDAGDLAPAPRLTRQRKLRHLTHQDIGFFHSDESSFLPGLPEFRSHAGSDHRSFSALPQPLPLPEAPLTRRAKSISSSSVNRRRLSSSLEQHGFAISR